jgi:hypothetical protein
MGVISDGKELLANRNAGPVGKALPTATCTVGEGGGGVSSAAVTFTNRTAMDKAVGKGTLLAKLTCFAGEQA